MTVFVAVAEAESFAAGARRLGMSAPAVTRAVAALEQRLGAKLLHRTTRRVRTTDAGLRYLEDARRLIADADEADEMAAGIHAEPRGHLSITAPMLFGKMYVTPGVVAFLERYPEMEVSALYLDRVVSLMEEDIDVGIRIGELPDSSMRAVRVGTVRRVLCASPRYLERWGVPSHPEQLRQHRIIAASGVTPTVEWGFQQELASFHVRIKPRLTVSSNDAAIEAAVAGFGVTRLISYQISSQLSEGSLSILLPAFEPPSLPIHIVYREGRRASAKVRTFVDLMVDMLRADHRINGTEHSG